MRSEIERLESQIDFAKAQIQSSFNLDGMDTGTWEACIRRIQRRIDEIQNGRLFITDAGETIIMPGFVTRPNLDELARLLKEIEILKDALRAIRDDESLKGYECREIAANALFDIANP